jgi:hypothetical protein
MTANIETPGPGSSGRRRALRLRIIGAVVLLLGIVGAEMIYWRGTPDLSDDPSMLGYDKAESRQAGILYGQQGVVVQEWSNALKQPGTQAVIILVAAAVVAVGCFYFARLSANEGKHADKTL